MRKRNPAVYEIKCLVTGYRYVGSSIEINGRWAGHIRSLKKGNHQNRYLQRAWNKYGEKQFVFRIIRVIFDEVKRLACEQFYIDKYLAEGTAYNCNPRADRPCASPEVIRASQLKIAHIHRANAKSQWANPESRAKILAGIIEGGKKRRGKPNPKLSKALKELMALEPERWKPAMQAVKKYWADPENRKHHGKVMKGKWVDPKWRAKAEKRARDCWTSELRANQSKINKRLWEDPAYRAMMAAREVKGPPVEVCRAAAIEQHKDPKYGRMSSKRLRHQWGNPEWRALVLRRQAEGRAAKAAAISHVI